MKVRNRRKLTRNALCPTGQGRGVDPSCGGSTSRADMIAAIKARVYPAKVYQLLLRMVFLGELSRTESGGGGFPYPPKSVSYGFPSVHNSLVTNPFVSEAQRRKCWAADDPAWDCRGWSHATKDLKSLPSKVGKARKKAKRKLTANKGKVRGKGGVGPNKVDPSRTLTLRRWMTAQLRKRFGALKGRIYKLVVQEDAFGLVPRQPLSTNEFNPDQQRDEHGKWTKAGAALSAVVDSVKAAGALAAHVEHAVSAYVKDGIGNAVARLPSPLQAVAKGAFIGGKALTAVAFANWSLGQNLAERVSRERGATPEEARRLRGVLSTIDSKTFEAFKVTALVGVHAAHLPAVITGTVPAATTAYLCYSTARDPLATIRAATKMVKGLVPEQRLAGNAAIDRVQLLDRVLLAHGYDDWYIALLSAALDHTDNVEDAVTLADRLYELSPEQPADVPSSQEDGGQGLFDDLVGNNGMGAADGQQRGDGSAGRGDEQRPQGVGGTLASEVEGHRTPGNHQGEVRNTRWQFATSADKVKAFQDWLRAQVKDTVTSVSDEELWHRYIEAGFRKGAGRSYDDVKRKAAAAGGQDALDFYSGTRDEFLRDSFARPVTREKVELLAGRAYDDLEGVTEDMGLRMSRSLADGLVEGKSPLDVARDLNDDLELGKDRSILIARTEVVRAHAEGQLTALEGLGIDEIGVAVEWSSTGDSKVCPQCRPLQGIVLTVDEARGLLPRHPQCRCAFTPANVGEDGEGQKRSKPDIDTALKESVDAEVTPGGGGRGKKGVPAKPRESDWAGADLDVDENRPVQEPLTPLQVANLSDGDLLTQFVDALNAVYSNTPLHLLQENAFCPTGEGGGINPSCPAARRVGESHETSVHLHGDLEGRGQAPPIFHHPARVKVEEQALALLGSAGKKAPSLTFRVKHHATVVHSGDRTMGTVVPYEDSRGLGVEVRGPVVHGKNQRAVIMPDTAPHVTEYRLRRVLRLPVSKSLRDRQPTKEGVDNAFCPTGQGGGVDPSCSPGQGTSGLRDAEGVAGADILDDAKVRSTIDRLKSLHNVPVSKSSDKVPLHHEYAVHRVMASLPENVSKGLSQMGVRVNIVHGDDDPKEKFDVNGTEFVKDGHANYRTGEIKVWSDRANGGTKTIKEMTDIVAHEAGHFALAAVMRDTAKAEDDKFAHKEAWSSAYKAVQARGQEFEEEHGTWPEIPGKERGGRPSDKEYAKLVREESKADKLYKQSLAKDGLVSALTDATAVEGGVTGYADSYAKDPVKGRRSDVWEYKGDLTSGEYKSTSLRPRSAITRAANENFAEMTKVTVLAHIYPEAEGKTLEALKKSHPTVVKSFNKLWEAAGKIKDVPDGGIV